MTGLIWRRGWDSNPRAAFGDKTLSRRPRYDHFGTSPQEAYGRPEGLHDARYTSVAGLKACATQLAEELLHRRAAFIVEHAADDGEPVVQGRVLVRALCRRHRARFRFGRAVHQCADP